MEDYNTNLLNDSKNEWCIRLMNILSGHIIDGFRSIFNESLELCETNDEPEKYLMTFQNFLSRIPKWNQSLIETECTRIIETSKCDYLEDLITCVHVVQLKILSCVRTSNQNKKIDINIPDLNVFLHNIYINIARKLYSNIYLFQIDITPLEQQKNNREFEVIVQSCIMNSIRDNIPIDNLLKQYIDETQDIDIIKQEKVIKHEFVDEVKPKIDETHPENETDEDEKNTIIDTESESSIKKKTKLSFDNVVEKHDPVNNETVTQDINFEPKPELPLLSDDDDDDLIKIGEPINLNFDNLDNVIDLGIEEL